MNAQTMSMNAQTKPTEPKSPEPQNVFVTQKIYIKGKSIEVPLAPNIFKETNLAPNIEMKVQTNYSELETNTFEAVLSLDLTNKTEDKVLWQIHLQQAGIFTIEGFPKEQLEPALYGFCMNLLYPYACATISDMAVKSGFSPVYLVPMNFEALYQEQKRRQAEELAKTKAAESTVA